MRYQVRTSLAGNSTIRLPSLSRIFFSRRRSTVSRMTCTISIALGSRSRKGIVINLKGCEQVTHPFGVMEPTI